MLQRREFSPSVLVRVRFSLDSFEPAPPTPNIPDRRSDRRWISTRSKPFTRRSTPKSPWNHQVKVRSSWQSLNLKILLFRTGCEDLLCPFLKTAPIALHRVNIDQDAIEINRRSSSGFSSLADQNQLFKYDRFLGEKIEAKKRDNSYRVFKRIERKSGLFPQAEAKTELDSRTITVWCSNDYLGLGQHPKLKKAVM